MKTTFTILLALLAVTSFSQKQLEFNQVKLVSSEETVPTDKVWKVVSALSSNGLHANNNSTSEVTSTIIINNNSVVIAGRSFRFQGGTNTGNSAGRTSDQSYGEYTILPIWLPSGATLESMKSPLLNLTLLSNAY